MPTHVTTTINPRRGTNPLIGNVAVRITADTVAIPANLGFIPAVTGFARVVPGDYTSNTEVDVPCVAGVHVPLDIREFDATNSTAGQELVIIRQGAG